MKRVVNPASCSTYFHFIPFIKAYFQALGGSGFNLVSAVVQAQAVSEQRSRLLLPLKLAMMQNVLSEVNYQQLA